MDLTEEIRGSWWLPGTRDAAVHGTLSTVDDAVSLDLLGSLAAGGGIPEFSVVEEEQIVHGRAANGDAVTLLGCRRTTWSMTSAGTRPEGWYVGAVVIGRHLSAFVK